jgi:hypothetical protein
MSQGLASFEKETPTGPVMLPAFYQKPKELRELKYGVNACAIDTLPEFPYTLCRVEVAWRRGVATLQQGMN